MIGLAGWLLRGASRADRLRAALLAAGSALGTGFLLCGVVVATIGSPTGADSPPSCRNVGTLAVCGPQVAPGVPRYTSHLLTEPGLRPGVVLAFGLLLIPVLVFCGQCARIAAARRDRRLATLRLAGATPGQVRAFVAIESGAACALGAVVGWAGFFGLRALLESRHTAGTPRSLPTDVPLPVSWTVAAVLVVPVLGTAASALALRRVNATPLGVVRRRRADLPPGWPVALLLVGVAGMAVPTALASAGHIRTAGPFVELVLLAALLAIIGLLASAAWLTGRAARVLARHTRRASLLLAARRLEHDPYRQARALSAVLLCVLFASAASALRAATIDSVGDGDGFYASAYDLVTLAVGVALAVAATGLLVGNVEAVMERRRELAALVAAGTPRGTLRRALLAQAVLPAIPAVVVAAASGAGAGFALGAGGDLDVPIPVLRLALVVVVALAAVGLATALTLPALRQSLRPAELRHD